jgi:hypothetical protein
MLTESMLMASLAGVVGLLLTCWLLPVLLWLTPPMLPIRPAVHLDGRVFAFTALVAALTGFLFGFAPAGRGRRPSCRRW